MTIDGSKKPVKGIRAKRRQALLEDLHRIALKQYQERGYDGMSLREVCDEAGISFRTMFRHVKGKDAILGYDVEREFADITARFLARAAAEPVLVAYRSAIDGMLQRAIDDPDWARLTLQLVHQIPALRAQYLVVDEHATDAMDHEFARRLGRALSDPRVSLLRSFLETALVKALSAWVAEDGHGDLRAIMSEFLSLLAPVELAIRVSPAAPA